MSINSVAPSGIWLATRWAIRFLFRPHHFAIVIGGVDRAGRQRSAAVVALNLVLIGKVIQITANRLRADVEMFDQFFRTDITLQAHQLDNCVMTLCLLHDNPLKRPACTWLLLFVVRAMTRVPKMPSITLTLNRPRVPR